MFKVNNKNTLFLCRSVVCIVSFKHISYLFLVFPLLTLNKELLAGKVKLNHEKVKMN